MKHRIELEFFDLATLQDAVEGLLSYSSLVKYDDDGEEYCDGMLADMGMFCKESYEALQRVNENLKQVIQRQRETSQRLSNSIEREVVMNEINKGLTALRDFYQGR
jgi:hypothetical protein